MSDMNLTGRAYDLFAGIPVAQSSQAVSGDSESFVEDLFSGETLSPNCESDGSTSYYNENGELLAVIDADGNVYANVDGEIYIYNAGAAEEQCEETPEAAKSTEPSVDFAAQVCEAKPDVFDPAVLEEPQSVMPDEESSAVACESAARNLFGPVEGFTGIEKHVCEEDVFSPDGMTCDEGFEVEGGECVDPGFDMTEEMQDELAGLFDRLFGGAEESAPPGGSSSSDTPTTSSGSTKKSPEKGDVEMAEAVSDTTTDDGDDDWDITVEMGPAEESTAAANPDEATTYGAEAGSDHRYAETGGGEAFEGPEFAQDVDTDFMDDDGLAFAKAAADRFIESEMLSAQITGSSDHSDASSLSGLSAHGTDGMLAGAAMALTSSGVAVDGRIDPSELRAEETARMDKRDDAAVPAPYATPVSLEGAGEFEVAQTSKVGEVFEGVGKRALTSPSQPKVMRSSMAIFFDEEGMLPEGSEGLEHIIAKFGGLPPSHLGTVSFLSVALSMLHQQESRVVEPQYAGGHGHGEGEGKDQDEDQQGQDQDEDQEMAFEVGEMLVGYV